MDIIIHDNYEDIDGEYKEYIEKNYLNSNESSKEWLLLLENSLSNYEPLYIIGLKNNNIISFCTGYIVRKLNINNYLSGFLQTFVNSLDRLHLNPLKFNVVFLTTPMSTYSGIKSNDDLFLNEFVEKTREKIYKKRKADSIFINNITDNNLSGQLFESGFIKIPFFPNTVLDTNYESFDSYLASLKKKKRWDLRNKIKKMNEYGAEIHIVKNEDFEEYSEIYKLYENTSQKNEDFPTPINYSELTFSNWKNMSNAYKWIIIKIDEKIIAFALLVKENNELLFKHVGLDYEHSRQSFAYFNLYYAAIRYAVEGNYKMMYCGATTYETKKNIGCTLVETNAFLSLKNKYLQKFITRILRKAFN